MMCLHLALAGARADADRDKSRAFSHAEHRGVHVRSVGELAARRGRRARTRPRARRRCASTTVVVLAATSSTSPEPASTNAIPSGVASRAFVRRRRDRAMRSLHRSGPYVVGKRVPEQLGRVLPGDAAGFVVGDALVAQLARQHRLRVRPRRVGVRVVALDEDVVDADAMRASRIPASSSSAQNQKLRRSTSLGDRVDVAPRRQVAELVAVAVVEAVDDARPPSRCRPPTGRS